MSQMVPRFHGFFFFKIFISQAMQLGELTDDGIKFVFLWVYISYYGLHCCFCFIGRLKCMGLQNDIV